MPVQYYIKHAFENEGASISEIARKVVNDNRKVDHCAS